LHGRSFQFLIPSVADIILTKPVLYYSNNNPHETFASHTVFIVQLFGRKFPAIPARQ
jgi:hypothetical protein